MDDIVSINMASEDVFFVSVGVSEHLGYLMFSFLIVFLIVFIVIIDSYIYIF